MFGLIKMFAHISLSGASKLCANIKLCTYIKTGTLGARKANQLSINITLLKLMGMHLIVN